MTLNQLKKHKVLFIAICLLTTLVAVFAVMKTRETGATGGGTTGCTHEWEYTKVDSHWHQRDCKNCNASIFEEHNWYYRGGSKGHREYCENCDYVSEEILHENGNFDTDNNGKCDKCQATLESSSGGSGTGSGSGDSTGDGSGDGECQHTYAIKTNDTHHWQACSECQEEKENTKSEHTFGNWVDTGDGKTHKKTCTYTFPSNSNYKDEMAEKCGYVKTADHTFENGTCTDCGAVEPAKECEHEYSKIEKDDTHHWVICSKCGEEKENSKANHTYGTYTDNGDGTHTATCTFNGCGQKLTKVHEYENGTCTDCGAVEPAKECEHEYSKIEKDDTHHWVICSKCGEEKENSKANHTYGTYTDNGNGTHTATCTFNGCGQKLTKAHEYENGTCTDCGAVEPAKECEHEYSKIEKDDTHHWVICSKCGEEKENSKANHTYGTYTDNGNGTHTATCTFNGCGQKLTNSHKYVDGTCTDCEAKQPVSGDNNNNDNNNENNDNNNDNNNNNENNDNNNSNNNSNNNNTGKDNTVADKEIPKTGKPVMAGAVVALIIATGVGIVKFKKYKNI